MKEKESAHGPEHGRGAEGRCLGRRGGGLLPQFRRGGAEGQAHVGTRVPVRHREYIEFIDLLLFRV